MRGNLFKCKYFLIYSPALASIAKLVPVQYREYEYGLLQLVFIVVSRECVIAYLYTGNMRITKLINQLSLYKENERVSSSICTMNVSFIRT